MNAVIYARYSSHAQNDASIEQQIAECQEYAKAHNYTILATYADRAMSGRSDRRPEFQRMLRASERREFQVVLAYKSNRIARNMLHALSYENKLAQNGVNVIYCKEEFGDNAAGRFALRTMMNVNQFYSENMAEDITRGMMDNAQQCKVNGSVPYGYRRGEDGHYEIDERSAPIIREIFARMAAGETKAHIIAELNRRQFKTKTGREWNRNSFSSILKNERYTGVYIYKDVRIDGGIPPIISRKMFDAAQETIEKSRERVQGRKWRDDMEYELTGKLFCGKCGSPMVGSSGTGKLGKMYYYYRCKHCEKKPIRKDVVEPLVVDALKQCISQPENVEWMVDLVMQYKDEIIKESDVGYLEKQLKEIKTKKANVLKAIEMGIITETTKGRLKELEAEEKDTLTALLKERRRIPDLTRDHVQFFFESFANGEITCTNYRKMLIKQFLRAVYLFDDCLKITFDFSESDTGLELPLESASDGVRTTPIWYTQNSAIQTHAELRFVGRVFVLTVSLAA